MLICSHQFHAVLLQQLSGRERKILDKLKNTVKRMLGLCTTLFVYICVCTIVCGHIHDC